MKGTEKIIAHIQTDASAQINAIMAQAKQQCAEIREDYDLQASEAYASRVRNGVKDCENRADSMTRIAQMEAKKSLLALKQDMVSACFDKAAAAIAALPAAEYTAFLAKLAADAASEGTEAIILNEKDQAAVGAAVADAANELLKAAGRKAELSLAKETGSFAGGLILRRGNVEVNCTLELLIDLARNEMSSEVAGVLFA